MIIEFFLYCGDDEIHTRIRSLFFGSTPLWKRISQYLNYDYGSGLKKILIIYYIDGTILTFPAVKRKLSNYNKDKQALSCEFNVSKDAIVNTTDDEILKIVKKTVSETVDLIEKRMEKKINFNFNKLRYDVDSLFQKL